MTPATFNFRWQDALAAKCPTPLDVVLKFDLIVDMATTDVKNILRKVRPELASSDNFDDFYGTVCSDIAERKLNKWTKAIENNAIRGVSLCLNSAEAIKWIIERIANEIKNLFDPRYINSCTYRALQRMDLDWIDGVNAVIDELNKLPRSEHVRGIRFLWDESFDLDLVEHLCTLFKIEKNEIFKDEGEAMTKIDEKTNQLFWNFDEEAVA